MNKLFAYLKKLIDGRFYGKIVIRFEAGRIVHFEKHISEDSEQFN